MTFLVSGLSRAVGLILGAVGGIALGKRNDSIGKAFLGQSFRHSSRESRGAAKLSRAAPGDSRSRNFGERDF